MQRDLTLKQISEANTLLQELVAGVTARWEGKGGISASEAYNIVDDIHNIIHNNTNTPADAENTAATGL